MDKILHQLGPEYHSQFGAKVPKEGLQLPVKAFLVFVFIICPSTFFAGPFGPPLMFGSDSHKVPNISLVAGGEQKAWCRISCNSCPPFAPPPSVGTWYSSFHGRDINEGIPTSRRSRAPPWRPLPSTCSWRCGWRRGRPVGLFDFREL